MEAVELGAEGAEVNEVEPLDEVENAGTDERGKDNEGTGCMSGVEAALLPTGGV
jgi:hypothetical protein